MKKVIAKGLALLFIGVATILAGGCIHKDVKEGLGPLVRLETSMGFNFCSGTVISKTKVLTAAHCVNDLLPFAQINIVDPATRETAIASVYAANSKTDLAVLTGDFSKFRSLHVVTDMSELMSITSSLTSKVLTCGFPYGSSGVCEKVTLQGPDEFRLQAIGGLMLPGMSGGPVVDPSSGNIIAINSGVTGGYLVFSPLIGIENVLNLKIEEEK